MRPLIGFAATVICLAGCFKTDVTTCAVACASSDDCPGELQCSPQGRCSPGGTACQVLTPDADLTQPQPLSVSARGIWVFNASGKHLGVIRMPEIAGNLNWGGREWRDLYCACSTSIYRVRMKVRGNPVAYMRMTGKTSVIR